MEVERHSRIRALVAVDIIVVAVWVVTAVDLVADVSALVADKGERAVGAD